MIIIDVVQGSKAWHEERRKNKRLTASEANAVMGTSQHCTRTELLDMKKFGIEEEVSSYVQKFIFDKGHEVEALARIISEKEIGKDLYPITGYCEIEGIEFLASFDGITINEDIVEEHKQWNEKLAESVRNGIVPDSHKWQLVQQQIVSGAKKTRFVVSDGTEDNRVMCEFVASQEEKEQLIFGCKQFNKDLIGHKYTPEKVKPEIMPLMDLPALSISLVGKVSSSNLAIYKTTALEFIRNINTDLKNDEDFALAEVTIKFCGDKEKELEAVKNHALSQTQDIDLLFKTIDQLKEEMRSKRLTLNKLVKSQKDVIKAEIVENARIKIRIHIDNLNKELKDINLPVLEYSFTDAIKGKRNISSMNDAVSTELARVKIEFDRMARISRANILYFDSTASSYKFLFNDLQAICNKDSQSFSAIVDSRITQHKEAEKNKVEAERQRIREEEQRKAEKKLQDERKKVRHEENLKAKQVAKEQLINKNDRELNKVQKESVDEKKPRTQVSPLSNSAMIYITVKEYKKLIEDSIFLDALKSSGVDSWSGYEYAQKICNEQQAA